MKTKGLMFIAFFVSGTAFAQTAAVKQDQQVKAGSKSTVSAAAGSQHVSVPANASTEANARSSSSVSAGQVNIQAGVAHNQESAVTADPAAVSTAKEDVKSGAAGSLETGVKAGNQLEKQMIKTGEATGQQVTQSVKNVTAVAGNAVRVNSTVNNSLKIKAAPVSVKTITSGAVGLKGL